MKMPWKTHTCQYKCALKPKYSLPKIHPFLILFQWYNMFYWTTFLIDAIPFLGQDGKNYPALHMLRKERKNNRACKSNIAEWQTQFSCLKFRNTCPPSQPKKKLKTMSMYLEAELVPDISDFFIPTLSPSLIAKKLYFRWMSCYSLSARIIKMFSGWKQKAGTPLIMGKRWEKMFCSCSFCQETQIICSHLLSAWKNGSLVLQERRKSLDSLQCFFYRTETDTLSLSTIPAFKARNWHILPKEIKCNENVFLVQVRDCICCIAVYVSWGQHNLLLSAVLGLFKHSCDWFSIALALGYLYLLLRWREHWPQQTRNFGVMSILHSQATDTNTYFKSGVLTSVEKAFLTHVHSNDKKTSKYLQLDDAHSPSSTQNYRCTQAVVLQDTRSVAGTSQSACLQSLRRGALHPYASVFPANRLVSRRVL